MTYEELEQRLTTVYWLLQDYKRAIENGSDVTYPDDILEMIDRILRELEGRRVQLDAAPE